MFSLNKAFLPLNLGTQLRAIGAGGPSGFTNGTAQATPWPYVTRTRTFIVGGIYGTVNTSAAVVPMPYITAATGFFIPGLQKSPTYTTAVF